MRCRPYGSRVGGGAWHAVARGLLQAAIGQGALNGAGRIQLIFAGDNWPMRRLAQKAGARLDLVFGQMYSNIDLSSGPATTEWLAARELFRS
jgi:hypothetical protein